MTSTAEPIRAPLATSRLAERIGLRYLCLCLVIPLIGYTFPFVAERVKPLKDLSVTYGGSILDHGHHLAGENADIILFGDSTIMFGVDTVRLSQELGLKVLNLPNTYGSLANTGDWALREYLASNKPPRLIVFQTAPWNMDFNQVPNPAPYEGDEEIVRHADWREFVRFTWAYPRQILLFPFRFYAVNTPLTSVTGDHRPHLASVTQGYTPNLLTATLHPGCVFAGIQEEEHGTGSVEHLLRAYRSPTTKTIAYLSPLPACRNVDPIAGYHYPGFDIAPPVVIPPEYISADFTHAHPTAKWVPYTTDLLAKVIRKALEP